MKTIFITIITILALTISVHAEDKPKKQPPLKPPVLRMEPSGPNLAQKSFAELFVQTLRRGEFECREVKNPAVCVCTALMNHVFVLVSNKDKDRVDVASRVLEDLAGESVYGEKWPEVRKNLHERRAKK